MVDDLDREGAEIWVETIRAVRKQSPETTMETLIGDFAGNFTNLQRVIDEKPEVVSHNIETVRRLTAQVRIQAKYDRSLEVIKRLHDAGVKTKSGLMLGLGETEEEFTLMRIKISNPEKTICYNLYDEYDAATQTSSMSRTTGYTCTAALNMLAQKLFTAKGVFPPELIGKDEACFNFMHPFPPTGSTVRADTASSPPRTSQTSATNPAHAS